MAGWSLRVGLLLFFCSMLGFLKTFPVFEYVIQLSLICQTLFLKEVAVLLRVCKCVCACVTVTELTTPHGKAGFVECI